MDKMLLIALGEYGVKEIKGKQHEARILEYFDSTNHDWVKTDETAWCSAVHNFCAKEAGLEHTGELNARSWLEVGTEVFDELPEGETNEDLLVRPGDTVIFWRESKDSWKGHVGIYINEIDGEIYCLGGNQSNSMKVSPYPKSRLLGYRRLRKLEDVPA